MGMPAKEYQARIAWRRRANTAGVIMLLMVFVGVVASIFGDVSKLRPYWLPIIGQMCVLVVAAAILKRGRDGDEGWWNLPVATVSALIIAVLALYRKEKSCCGA